MTTTTYAAQLIDAGRRLGSVPRYGTPEWEALPDTDPRKVAAVVLAAEAWRLDGTDEAITARLAEEFAVTDLMVRYRLAEASRDVADSYTAPRRTGAEIRKIRADADAGKYAPQHDHRRAAA